LKLYWKLEKICDKQRRGRRDVSQLSLQHDTRSATIRDKSDTVCGVMDKIKKRSTRLSS
jgi:hypothetical protein